MTKLRIHLTIDGVIESEETGSFRLPLDDGFSGELKRARLGLGLTLKELSDLSEVSPSHIARLERGERVPGRRILRKLEVALAKRQ